MNRKQRRSANAALRREYKRSLPEAEEERINRTEPPIEFDFTDRWKVDSDGKTVFDDTGLSAEQALGYHTAIAAFLARDDAVPVGKVSIPLGTFDRLNRGMLAFTLAGG